MESSEKCVEDALRRVREYHQLSKHAPNRYAPGPGRLDWGSQPDPFRTFAGAPRIPLPLVADALNTTHQACYQSAGVVSPAPLDGRGVAALLELSLGLSAWKVYQHEQWPLRCNPSSGNLHPTEGYLVLPALPAPHNGTGPPLSAGVYHYASYDHQLELRWQPTDADIDSWQQAFAPGTFLLGLSSIHWRESWKYGLRSFRYCHLNLGHAVAAIRYAAASLGWQACLLTGHADADLALLLALNKGSGGTETAAGESLPAATPEDEHPGLLLSISTLQGQDARPGGVPWLARQVNHGPWLGQANCLSRGHAQDWPGIATVDAATSQPPCQAERQPLADRPPLQVASPGMQAAQLIRQRRSGQRYDGHTFLAKTAFFSILDCCLARPGHPPWDLLPWPSRIHLILMVHRVTDLSPGLYALVRRADFLRPLQDALHRPFLWEAVTDAPQLPLYRLAHGEMQDLATHLSCQQEIAGDGAFSVGMLAEFDAVLTAAPWGYRSLHWEAGMLGQTLYLEAEAVGMRGTGIGCYFDDEVHHLLGVRESRLQSMYHFTIGNPLEDSRLQTRPPYQHIQDRGFSASA
ncbi:MAG: SagB/ThcOx family dehydrogenase [Magnetococcus sp. YQC-3]